MMSQDESVEAIRQALIKRVPKLRIHNTHVICPELRCHVEGESGDYRFLVMFSRSDRWSIEAELVSPQAGPRELDFWYHEFDRSSFDRFSAMQTAMVEEMTKLLTHSTRIIQFMGADRCDLVLELDLAGWEEVHRVSYAPDDRIPRIWGRRHLYQRDVEA